MPAPVRSLDLHVASRHGGTAAATPPRTAALAGLAAAARQLADFAEQCERQTQQALAAAQAAQRAAGNCGPASQRVAERLDDLARTLAHPGPEARVPAAAAATIATLAGEIRSHLEAADLRALNAALAAARGAPAADADPLPAASGGEDAGRAARIGELAAALEGILDAAKRQLGAAMPEALAAGRHAGAVETAAAQLHETLRSNGRALAQCAAAAREIVALLDPRDPLSHPLPPAAPPGPN